MSTTESAPPARGEVRGENTGGVGAEAVERIGRAASGHVVALRRHEAAQARPLPRPELGHRAGAPA
ncbi:hypothetical protein SAMN05216188_102548 [Lentzea xinjiangensis]|uniref:Uncharacterized protein n=1 Tax=Lentzea xinjiangensis TaxID=402600 RepID=A0A1H9EH98_9PSEU|nr:hypothetical protein [Lentzea xinjiangensis]SEQ25136.1 hypothetical protein SAMN05216188_102548 [Lentzea xinjiangensis]